MCDCVCREIIHVALICLQAGDEKKEEGEEEKKQESGNQPENQNSKEQAPSGEGENKEVPTTGEPPKQEIEA